MVPKSTVATEPSVGLMVTSDTTLPSASTGAGAPSSAVTVKVKLSPAWKSRPSSALVPARSSVVLSACTLVNAAAPVTYWSSALGAALLS